MFHPGQRQYQTEQVPEDMDALQFGTVLYHAQVKLLGDILDLRDELCAPKASLASQSRVADRLVQRQRLKEEKIQKLREEKEAKILKEMRSKAPSMNKKSRNMLKGREKVSLHERHKYIKEEKKKNNKRLKQMLDAQEMSKMKDSPTINKTSRRMAKRGVKNMMAWEERRQEKIKQLKAEKERNEARNNGTPKVSKGSEKILRRKALDQPQKSGKKKHDVPQVRLYKQAEVIKKRKEDRASEMRKEQHTFKPKLSAYHSTRHQRKRGDTSTRLYEMAKTREEKLVVAQQKHEFIESNLDKETGRMLFQPLINKHSKKIARRITYDEPVEDLLYAQGIMYERKKQAHKKRLEAEEDAKKQKSHISINSEVLAYREGDTKRIYRPIGKVKKSTIEGIDKPTFQPNVAPEQVGSIVNPGRHRAGPTARPKARPVGTSPSRPAPIVSEEEVNYYFDQATNSPRRAWGGGGHDSERRRADDPVRDRIFEKMRMPSRESPTAARARAAHSDVNEDRLRSRIFKNRDSPVAPARAREVAPEVDEDRIRSKIFKKYQRRLRQQQVEPPPPPPPPPAEPGTTTSIFDLVDNYEESSPDWTIPKTARGSQMFGQSYYYQHQR